MSEEPDAPFEDLPAEEQLKLVIGGWLIEQQLNEVVPMVAASNLFAVIYDCAVDVMGRAAVRAALLLVYEKSHDAPMSFIERGEAKRMLDQLSNARRTVEGKPGIIMPGEMQ